MALLGITLLSPQVRTPVKIEATDAGIAKQHLETGNSYFERGEFGQAVVEFERAYDLIKDPKLQYNIGECYTQLENFDKAEAAFQIYMEGVMKDDPAEKERWESAELAVAQIRMDRATFQKKETPPPAPTRPSPPPSKKQKIKLSRRVTVKEAPPGSYKPWMKAAFVVGGVGAVGGAVALSLGKIKESRHSDLVGSAVRKGDIQCQGDRCRYANQAAREEYEERLDKTKREMERFGTLSKIGFAVGGAALVTGGILFMLDRKPVRLAPKVGLGGAGVEAQIRW